ncbi:MAG: hypothetical protein RBG13Loki_2394 [Promethearchaeota archaeon CR_4]|nr:MAG: hypothetical protein RBG13Loki_2394 [Candidatus Lokiarchaeota archaeon CR_4]
MVILLQICVIDALTAGTGSRRFTRDFIGSGPWTVASIITSLTNSQVICLIFRAEQILGDKSLDLSKFDCLLISAMTMDKAACIKIIQKWRQTRGSAPVAIGGPICCEKGIREKLKVELATKGELELHLPEFSKFLNFASYNAGKPEMFSRTSQTVPPDFATFPRECKFIGQYPDFQHARIYVECVRGCSNYRRPKFGKKCPPKCNQCAETGNDLSKVCPQGIPPGCGYCGTHTMFGPPKSRAISAIINEIEKLISLGVTRIVLGGPDLLDFQREKAIAPIPLTSPKSPPDVNFEALNALISTIAKLDQVRNKTVQIFYENLKASLCSEEVFRILQQIPNPIFSIGVETGDPGQATLLGRPDMPEECLNAIALAKRMGFRVHAYFIHSLPGETPETARNTLAFLEKLRELDLEKITLYQFKTLPGTVFEHYRESKQQEKLMRPWAQKIKRFVIQYNNDQKNKYVGQVLAVDIVEKHKFRQGAVIGRIPRGGPGVEIEDGGSFIGQRKQVEITGVVSDRLLKGRLINA